MSTPFGFDQNRGGEIVTSAPVFLRGLSLQGQPRCTDRPAFRLPTLLTPSNIVRAPFGLPLGLATSARLCTKFNHAFFAGGSRGCATGTWEKLVGGADVEQH